MAPDTPALEAARLRKVYRRGAEDIVAVDDVSLTIRRGEFVSFIGPSGSGKTTLINILGCLDNATAGSLKIGGRTVFSEDICLSETALTRIRREVFGYIFQKFYLVPTLTVRENVLLPFAFFRKAEARTNPMEILAFLGLDRRIDHRPAELSGGEMQRVAIARALVNKPEILLADEPTGNLDSRTSDEIMTIFKDLNDKKHISIVMVTHEMDIGMCAKRRIHMKDGLIVREEVNA